MAAPGPCSVAYRSLFRYATPRERFIVALGCGSALVMGATIPVFALFFGQLLNAFWAADAVAEINKFCLIILGVAGVALLSGTVQHASLTWAGTMQANRVRHRYLAALLAQDMAFFDTAASRSDLLHGLRDEAAAFQEAVCDKLGVFLQGLACFAGAMAVSFTRSWDLSLVVLAAIPALLVVGALCGASTAKLQARASRAHSRAGGIAQEAVGNYRTLAAYGQEDATVESYSQALAAPTKLGEWQGLLAGFTLGSTRLVFFCSYALAVWYGSTRVAAGSMTVGQVWSVILSCVLGGLSLGGAMPHLAVFQRGRLAATSLFAVIERTSAQAAGSPPLTITFTSSPPGVGVEAGTGDKASSQVVHVMADATLAAGGARCRGDLELAGVGFAYPARPERPVFRSLSLVFPAGRTAALVGESGSGKSTVIQLLLRLYDPTAGTVLLDGRDARTLPLTWLRSQFGLVSQAPTLFAGSIFDNIALDSGATPEQVAAAAIAANAHGFVSKLPNGYDTPVGEKGAKLSGGQRQRIAIARAVLRNPQVLLLDEATSALDSGSEKAVQSALEALMPGRTCITVAHRLSTVAAADAIHVLRGGEVVESGTHRQLLKANGVYAALAARHALRMSDDGQGEEEVAAAVGETAGGARSQGGAMRTLRDSILRRGSVRLSVIPQALANKLSARTQQQGDGSDAPPVTFGRLATLNRPEWGYWALALVCAALCGLQMPAFSLAISQGLADMYSPDPTAVRSAGSKWALVFLGIGLGIMLADSVGGWSFGVMGQRLATRLRVLMLRSLLRQDAAFFDRPENGSGALMGSLAADAAAVRGAVGDRLGVLLTVLSCIIASYVIAFYHSWSVTLVVSAALPLLIASNVALTRVALGAQRSDRQALVAADALAGEALGDVKTVAAFGVAPSYVRLYRAELRRAAPAWPALWAGLGYGCSQFFTIGVAGLGFWFGSTQVDAGRLDFKQMLTANMAVFYAAVGLAQAQLAFPDLARAADAVHRTFRLLEARPGVDPSPSVGTQVELEGGVELLRVAFAYPSRPQRLVLKEFSLAVPAGTSCALVGESGHGKSTVVALLERFYDPLDGQVLIDGINVASLTLGCLRRQLALVGQEPVVFSSSILDNIAMGCGASMEAVAAAARAAHALDFIQALPEGFATRLGDGGSQLSGGQLQRLAIARAVLRAPRILLLDEPTSALDSESERVVQAALDEVMVGRTTIVVAHRLSTVAACTAIAAVYRGRVLEQGSHAELLAKAGYYAHLWSLAQA